MCTHNADKAFLLAIAATYRKTPRAMPRPGPIRPFQEEGPMLRWYAALGFVASITAPISTIALPAYATKEKKVCAFCHVSATGGGDLTAAGTYYAKHDHTLAGYDAEGITATKPKKTGPPAFLSTWKADLPTDTRRVAIGAVAPDGKPRLITLGAGNSATIRNLTASQPAVEGTVDLGADAARFVVLKPSKDQPAVLVAPGIVAYKDGDAFVKKAAPQITGLTGEVRFVDGAECAFFFDGYQAQSWSIDPKASEPVTAGRQLVMPDQGQGVYAEAIGRLPIQLMAALGWAPEMLKTGVAGMFDPREDGKLYVWAPWQDSETSFVTVTEASALLSSPDAKPIWRSPKIAGKILDVAYGKDPKSAKLNGILVLTETGGDKKGRQIEFFALD